MSIFDRAEFCKFVQVFISHVTFNLAETSVSNSRPSVPYRANFYILLLTSHHSLGKKQIR